MTSTDQLWRWEPILNTNNVKLLSKRKNGWFYMNSDRNTVWTLREPVTKNLNNDSFKYGPFMIQDKNDTGECLTDR